MWTTQEIVAIHRTLNDDQLSDILTTEEQNVIPESAIANIQSKIIEPKHNNPVSSIFCNLY